MKTLFLVLLLAAAGYWKMDQWAHPPIPSIANKPYQALVFRRSVHRGAYEIIPLRSYALTARVLGKCLYHPGSDTEADISPWDLALGWGPFADPAFSKGVSVTQSERFLNWNVKGDYSQMGNINIISANTHIIPADAEIQKGVQNLRAGDVVSMSGCLLRVRKDGGWVWQSSLTRSDTGEGACEVFYVETLRRMPSESRDWHSMLASFLNALRSRRISRHPSNAVNSIVDRLHSAWGIVTATF